MNKLLCGEYAIRRFKRAYYIAAAAAILGGMAIYVFMRNTHDLVLFHYFPGLSFINTLYFPIKARSLWSDIFVYNLPHGLWCLSGLLVIRAIWLANPKWRAMYGGLFLAVISFLELSQLSAHRPGTFDLLDLASYGVSAFLESITYNLFIRSKIL